MKLLDLFKTFTTEDEEISKYSKLHELIAREFESLTDEQALVAACVSGLMARVAYVDFHVDDKEVEKIEHLVQEFNFNFGVPAKKLVDVAIDHIKEMAGIENHLYVRPLNEVLDKDKRYEIIQCLFLIAASDGSVEGIESEEIRTISKGFELSSQHFRAAQAEVSDFLKSLAR